MERKIGEIFEYKGEWYQCLEEKYCNGCVFRDAKCDDVRKILGNCSVRNRSDKKSVIFKKLEKEGEPYIIGNKLIQRYKIYPTVYCINVYCWYYYKLDVKSWTIDLEIKQNKEDMEEKEQCGDNRFEVIEKAKKHLLSSTNIESSKEEMKVLDNFLIRCWQMGWLDKYNDTKHSNSENIGKNLRKFDLEAAKLGKPVCTRYGRKARIICFDAKDTQPIIGLYEKNIDGIVREYLCSYHTDGRMYDDQDTGYDLMMLPEKKEGWVNIDKGGSGKIIISSPYSTKEEAIHNDNETTIDTIKIYWEE